jgi:predicted RNA-binding Zn ribbon-like protein
LLAELLIAWQITEWLMSSRLVEGVALPLPVAGHPALDFCNTRAGWDTDQPKEYLRSPAVLALWCREAGLITAADAGQLSTSTEHHPQAALATLERALILREAIYRVSLGTGDQAHWDLLGAEAAAARSLTRLVPNAVSNLAPHPLPNLVPDAAGARARWQPDWSGPDAAVLAVAYAAADLLTGPRAGSVSACAGDGCGWLFSDPRGRRRWCEMAVCGNRAKARRHRRGRSGETRHPSASDP